MITMDLKQEASDRLGCSAKELETFCWDEQFSNTAGPHKGSFISGQAFTSFSVEAFRKKGEKLGIAHCDGLWKLWSGTTNERWDQMVYARRREEYNLDLEKAVGLLRAHGYKVEYPQAVSACSYCGKPADYVGPCGVGGCPLGNDL